MGRVTHFEIHASEPERLIDFYRRMFGWGFEAWGPPGTYWIVRTGSPGSPGIDGGLVPRRGEKPTDGQAVNASVCTVEVENAKMAIDDLVRHGGTIALPLMAVPGVGWLGYGKDPDGNLFGMMQPDPKAK